MSKQYWEICRLRKIGAFAVANLHFYIFHLLWRTLFYLAGLRPRYKISQFDINPFHNFQISRKIGFYETRIANILLAILLYSFEISGQIK